MSSSSEGGGNPQMEGNQQAPVEVQREQSGGDVQRRVNPKIADAINPRPGTLTEFTEQATEALNSDTSAQPEQGAPDSPEGSSEQSSSSASSGFREQYGTYDQYQDNSPEYKKALDAFQEDLKRREEERGTPYTEDFKRDETKRFLESQRISYNKQLREDESVEPLAEGVSDPDTGSGNGEPGETPPPRSPRINEYGEPGETPPPRSPRINEYGEVERDAPPGGDDNGDHDLNDPSAKDGNGKPEDTGGGRDGGTDDTSSTTNDAGGGNEGDKPDETQKKSKVLAAYEATQTEIRVLSHTMRGEEEQNYIKEEYRGFVESELGHSAEELFNEQEVMNDPNVREALISIAKEEMRFADDMDPEAKDSVLELVDFETNPELVKKLLLARARRIKEEKQTSPQTQSSDSSSTEKPSSADDKGEKTGEKPDTDKTSASDTKPKSEGEASPSTDDKPSEGAKSAGNEKKDSEKDKADGGEKSASNQPWTADSPRAKKYANIPGTKPNFGQFDDVSYGERGPGDEHMSEEELIARRMARGNTDTKDGQRDSWLKRTLWPFGKRGEKGEDQQEDKSQSKADRKAEEKARKERQAARPAWMDESIKEGEAKEAAGAVPTPGSPQASEPVTSVESSDPTADLEQLPDARMTRGEDLDEDRELFNENLKRLKEVREQVESEEEKSELVKQGMEKFVLENPERAERLGRLYESDPEAYKEYGSIHRAIKRMDARAAQADEKTDSSEEDKEEASSDEAAASDAESATSDESAPSPTESPSQSESELTEDDKKAIETRRQKIADALTNGVATDQEGLELTQREWDAFVRENPGLAEKIVNMAHTDSDSVAGYADIIEAKQRLDQNNGDIGQDTTESSDSPKYDPEEFKRKLAEDLFADTQGAVDKINQDAVRRYAETIKNAPPEQREVLRRDAEAALRNISNLSEAQMAQMRKDLGLSSDDSDSAGDGSSGDKTKPDDDPDPDAGGSQIDNSAPATTDTANGSEGDEYYPPYFNSAYGPNELDPGRRIRKQPDGNPSETVESSVDASTADSGDEGEQVAPSAPEATTRPDDDEPGSEESTAASPEESLNAEIGSDDQDRSSERGNVLGRARDAATVARAFGRAIRAEKNRS